MNGLPNRTAIAMLLVAQGLAVAATDVIESPTLAVTIDRGFPRVVSYQLKPSGAMLDGQPAVLSRIGINGRDMECGVRYEKVSPATAQYEIEVPGAQMTMVALLGVQSNTVLFRITQIRERGTAKVMTIAIPEHSLISLCSTQAGAAVAVSTAGDREHIQPLVAYERGPRRHKAGYVFMSGGGVAAGVTGNVIAQKERIAYQIFDERGTVRCRAWCAEWTYRAVDTETIELPWARVYVTGDRNGDGTADWQDAAILMREGVRTPFGAEHVPRTVVSQIGMNIASLGQQPFLRILDNVKKAYLYTDGLGQEVLLKGYQSEVPDSAHSDSGTNFNARAGGQREWNTLLAGMKKWHARGGIHINAAEVDVASGRLYRRLDEMRAEMPSLDFVYADVYFDTDWVAYKMAAKLKRLGLPLYTEFSTVFDHDSVWSHQRTMGNRVIRFMWNHCRDVWQHDPLLRGADHPGFMGWSNGMNVCDAINTTFRRNLPTKYLQHFRLMHWTDNAAVFESGVRSEMVGGENVISRNGRVIARDNRLFIPWDPISENKIYMWTDTEEGATWDLPASWTNRGTVWLYRLTDMGRVLVTNIPVTQGKVTVSVPTQDPHVLYPATVWEE